MYFEMATKNTLQNYYVKTTEKVKSIKILVLHFTNKEIRDVEMS